MSGRRSRAKLLLPSFVMVASASACGHTAYNEDPPYEPPYNPPNPNTTCPAVAPTLGAVCSGTQTCEYGGTICDASYQRFRCGGTWEQDYSYSCNPPPPAICPSTPPSEAEGCSEPGFSCSYEVEGCGSIAVMCDSDRKWTHSSDCTPSCPAQPPSVGSACLGDLSCVYGDCDEASHAVITSCSGGTWHLSEAACPPDGAGGEGGLGGEGGAFGGAPSSPGGAGGDG